MNITKKQILLLAAGVISAFTANSAFSLPISCGSEVALRTQEKVSDGFADSAKSGNRNYLIQVPDFGVTKIRVSGKGAKRLFGSLYDSASCDLVRSAEADKTLLKRFLLATAPGAVVSKKGVDSITGEEWWELTFCLNPGSYLLVLTKPTKTNIPTYSVSVDQIKENGVPGKQYPVDYEADNIGFAYLTQRHTRESYGYGIWHPGIDWNTSLDDTRTSPVVAIADGVVLEDFARKSWGGILVRHKDGYISQYGHVFRLPNPVKEGQCVMRGQTIAYVGNKAPWKQPIHLHAAVIRPEHPTRLDSDYWKKSVLQDRKTVMRYYDNPMMYIENGFEKTSSNYIIIDDSVTYHAGVDSISNTEKNDLLTDLKVCAPKFPYVTREQALGCLGRTEFFVADTKSPIKEKNDGYGEKISYAGGFHYMDSSADPKLGASCAYWFFDSNGPLFSPTVEVNIPSPKNADPKTAADIINISPAKSVTYELSLGGGIPKAVTIDPSIASSDKIADRWITLPIITSSYFLDIGLSYVRVCQENRSLAGSILLDAVRVR